MRRSYDSWTPEQEETLRHARQEGLTAGEIAKLLNRTTASIQCKTQGGEYPLGKRATHPLLGGEANVLPLPGLDDLRPVILDGPAPKRRAVTANAGVTVVAGDFHFPQQDDDAVSVLLETIRELRPSRVILNGDLPDLLAVSKYPKDARPKHNWALRDEAVAMHAFLQELERVLPADCELVETEANHSGNGTGSRWWRYLSDRIPHLLSMEGAEDKLSYQAWWYPTWSRLTLVDSVVLAGGLLVTHGDMARKWAAYSARAHAEKYQHSVLHSHTHRMGSSLQRVPQVGERDESVIRAYEVGCMCRLEPSYASAPNWSQGFAVVVDDGEEYGVELVNVVRGRAAVASLGRVVRAA